MEELRPLTADDLEAVAARLSAEFPLDALTVTNVRAKIWGDSHHEPDLNLGLWVDGALRAVLLAVVRSGRSWIKVLTVHPRADHAEALLAALEANLRERCVSVIDVSGSAPCYFLPGCDATDTASNHFYLRHGFRRVGEAFNMSVDLQAHTFDTSAREVELKAAGYKIARLEPSQAPKLTDFVERRFSPGWALEALEGLDQDPPTVHVAWHHGRVVAFAVAEATNPGWFGPMGTHAKHRQHGLGAVLLHRCLADLRTLGYREAQIGWVGPLGFYARHCDARVSRVFWQYRKELRD